MIKTVNKYAAIDRVRRRHVLVLGSAHFHIAGGHSATVKVKLSAKALRKLGRRDRFGSWSRRWRRMPPVAGGVRAGDDAAAPEEEGA